MKRLTIAGALLTASALAGCSYTSPVEPLYPALDFSQPSSATVLSIGSPTPVVTPKAVVAAPKPATTEVAQLGGGYAWPGSYPVGGYTTGGYVAYVPVPQPQPQVMAPPPLPAPTVAATPMAVHAGVPTPYGPSNALYYDGYNGVRPFLVQSGAVWNGPSTYMLPLGATPGTHQHVETVSSDYVTETRTQVVSTLPSTRTATAIEQLSIRKGPSRSEQTCAVIPKGRSATVYECANGWCRVNYNGTDGWSRQTYLSFSN